jgi:hypothetical protein
MDEFDLTSMQIAGEVLGEQLGHGVLLTHPKEKCEGRGIPCCIHNPSDHHMRTWEMNWRGDTGVMERICPHGVGHPDPDHMAYVTSLTPEHVCMGVNCPHPHLDWQGIHGCDGCC